MSAPSAAILGCAGTTLSEEERAFFADASPWGFILFARNVASPEQMRALTDDLRAAVGRDAPILIDQEGGRVARMRAPYWREWPWMTEQRAKLSDRCFTAALRLQFRLIARELRAAGLDVNCMPIADVAVAGADPIIADRALGTDAAQVAAHARAVAEALLEGGVLPVVKHLPGHGRARSDSHKELPVVDATLEELRETDFAAFASLADLPLGMTAHIVYTAIDPDSPATTSPAGIRAIREEIGFDGLLMTDDLSMNALQGTPAARAKASLAAGCDVILHCNGDREEMESAMSEIPALTGRALERAEAAEAARRAPGFFDPEEAGRRHHEIFACADERETA